MDYRKCFFTLLFCLFHLGVSANRSISVGAIVETETHLWSLDTICVSEKCSIFQWTVKGKKRNVNLLTDKKFKLIDCETGKVYDLIDIFVKNRTMQSLYSEDNVYMRFPGLPNTPSKISIYLSSSFYVDSIFSYITPEHISVCRYQVPLYHYPKTNNLSDSIKYIDNLYNEGIDFASNQKYYNAILSFEKELAFGKLLYKTFTERLIKSSNTKEWLAYCYYKIGDIVKAKMFSWDYKIKPHDRNKTREADSLLYLAYLQRHIDNISLYKQICKLNLTNLGASSYHYIESLCELGDEYYDCGDYENAKRTFSEALNLLKKSFSENLCIYMDCYEGLARVEEATENYLSAAQYEEKAVMVICDTLSIDDDFYHSHYDLLVGYYAKAGLWDKASRIQKRLVEYWRMMYHKSVDNEYDYIMKSRRLFQLLKLSGNSKEAIREIRKFVNAASTLNQLYINGMNIDIADNYYNIGDFRRAKAYYEKANYGIGTAKSLAALGDYQGAIELLKEEIDKMKKRNQITIDLDLEQLNGPYDSSLCDLADYYNKTKQYDNALFCEEQHRKLSRFELARSYMNKGNAYAGMEMPDSAVCYFLKAKGIYGLQHQNRQSAIVLSKLLAYCGLNGPYDCYIHELSKSVGDDLTSSFIELTYDERSRYVEFYTDIMNRIIPMYAYYTHSDSIIEAAYNSTLMIKGALLNSENSVKRVIEESKDASMKDLWEEMRADRYILSKVLEKDSLDRKLNTDSLQNVIYNLEDSLVVKCKEYGDITRSMKLKWQDIQKRLSPKDIAIEFLRVPVNNDSIMYVALALRKDSETPKMVPLFEEKQLKHISDTLYYQCKEMTDLVWTPLLSELEGIKSIYFSPSGALYNLGIEYLPGMEEYNIYRLSSTRELVTRKESETGRRAVLYGGLDYYADLDTLSSSRSQARISETFVEHADVRGLTIRGALNNLEYTQEEVENIGKELQKRNWTCLLDTMSMGTEESFKSLSGKGINTIHIATHGFYYTQEDANYKGYHFMLLDDNRTSAEDKALTRSGLLMSGANHIMEGENLPDNVEDGILTAKEIADVDLRGLDLVVLSACQTGLGDISLGEGVFGLQRGFKKAGANSILMSLWEVNDEATQILMTQFYKNWLSGQGKRPSLLSAQKYLREAEGGKYNDPKYWAAFIMLDGLK